MAEHCAGSPTIGVDIGGTKILAGLVAQDGVVLGQVLRQTPGRSTSSAVVEQVIVEVVDELVELSATLAGQPAAVGVGAAGFVSADGGTVAFAPHLSWRDEPLRDRLEDRLGLPVAVDNDANCAARAEWRFGAGQQELEMVMVTLGTGIGGAHVLDGQVRRGSSGMAGELGHMVVVPGGHRCECGNRGCWEQYASGNALVREARELLAAGSPVAAALAAALPDGPERLSGALVTELAAAGDPMCTELVREVADWFGVGLANVVAILDPGLVVVGGGVSAAGELLLRPARESLLRHLVGRGYRPQPRVVAAQLGPAAGMIGAADLARTAGAGG